MAATIGYEGPNVPQGKRLMFSQTGEYVLRVVVFLASRNGQAATTHQIAQATRVPEGYLAKVLQSLGRAGLVDSQRGLHGGFVLAKSPQELSVYNVLEAVDPMRRIRTCPLNIASHGVKLCPLHQRLDDALAMVENAFRKSTIADLLEESAGSKPLCDTDQQAPSPRKTAAARKA